MFRMISILLFSLICVGEQYSIVQNLTNTTSYNITHLALSQDLNFLFLKSYTEFTVFGLNGSKYKSRQGNRSLLPGDDIRLSTSSNGSVFAIAAKVYTAPDYDYELYQSFPRLIQSAVSGNGLVYAGFPGSNKTLSIWTRPAAKDPFEYYANITLQKQIFSDILIDFNASTIMLCTYDIVYVYQNKSGAYRMVDSFSHYILTGDPNLRATPNLTAIVAFRWTNAAAVTVNIFRYQDNQYTLNQSLKYNTNYTDTIMDVYIDDDVLFVVFLNVVRIYKTNNGLFEEVQTIKQKTYAAIAKNRTFLTAYDQTLNVWRRNGNTTKQSPILIQK